MSSILGASAVTDDVIEGIDSLWEFRLFKDHDGDVVFNPIAQPALTDQLGSVLAQFHGDFP